jgi:hypothetical protein
LKTWKEMRWPERLKLVGLSLLPALILLIVAQLLAYMTIHRDVQIEHDPVTDQVSMYQMSFGKGWWRTTSRTPLNAWGFPDKEFAGIGPKGGCVHVVFAGDSFTFGDAVDRHRNYFALVETWTARRFPDRCIRMFNIAERKTTIDEQSDRIRETLEVLNPDLVILGIYQNDLADLLIRGEVPHEVTDAEEGEGWWGVRIWNRIPLANSSLVRFLTYRAFAFMITRGIEYDLLAQWSVIADPGSQDLAARLTSAYRRLFLELQAELRERDVELGVVIMPSKLDIMARQYPEEPFFIELAEEAGVPFVSTFDALDRNRRPYPFQMYDGHLSEAGNAVVAEDVFQWLFSGPDGSPFAALRRAGSPTEDADDRP